MPEIVENCPLCGSGERELFDRRNFRGVEVINQLCRSCGFVYQSPRMSAGELQTYYVSEYRTQYQNSSAPTPKDLGIQAERARIVVERLRRKAPRLRRVLDIGCSAGLLLIRFQQEYPCQVAGIEPGEVYREFARAQNLEVYASLDELGQTNPERFDLISMMHVLEHLPDPVKFLQELRQRYLYPQGGLLLEVPNLYVHESFEVAHLSAFSVHTLAQTVHKAGFRREALWTHGLPRSRIFPLYITLLARPAVGALTDGSPHREPGMRIKRYTGMFFRRSFERLFPGLAWLPFPEYKADHSQG